MPGKRKSTPDFSSESKPAVSARAPAVGSDIYRATLNALIEVLLTATAGTGGGLPVPALLEIIRDYAIAEVTTWIDGIRWPLGITCGQSPVTNRSELWMGCGSGGTDVCVQRYDVATNVLTPYPEWTTGGTADTIAVDPLHPGRVFVLTFKLVLGIDSKGVVTTLCARNGMGSGLVFSADSKSLIWSGSAPCLYSVTVEAPHVTSVLADTASLCYFMVWCRTTAKPRSVMYMRHGDGFARFDVDKPKEGAVNIPLSRPSIWIGGLTSTVSGHVIATHTRSNTIWVIDPMNGECTRLAGAENDFTYSDGDPKCSAPPTNGDPLTDAKFYGAMGLTVVDSEHALAVAEYAGHRIRRVPLPAFMFVPKQHASSARDGPAPET